MPSLPENAVSPEIRDDEPLRRDLVVPIRGATGGLGHHHVDAGRELRKRLADREGRGDVGIEHLLDLHLSLPDLRAPLLGQTADVVAVEVALEVAPDHGVDEVAIADAINLECDRRGIDADDRNAELSGAGQHIRLAGEACDRLAVAHIDVELGGFRQRLLHHRRDAGAQRDSVALAVLEALDAQLAVLGGQSGLVLAGDGDERREVDATAGKPFGELEAHPRRGGVRIDRVVEQPEAVFLAHAFVLLTDVGDFAQIERDAKRIQRRPPHRAVGIAACDHHQAVGFLGGISATALIGDVGGGGGALEQFGAFAIVAWTNLQHGFGEAQPVGAVVRRGDDKLPENLHAGAEVVALEGGVSFPPQRDGGLGDRPGLTLDLRFEFDGGVGEVVALVRLVGGNDGEGQQNNQRGGNNTANKRKHGEPPAAGVGDCRAGRSRSSRKDVEVVTDWPLWRGPDGASRSARSYHMKR